MPQGSTPAAAPLPVARTADDFVQRACTASDQNLADYLAHCARTAIGPHEVCDEQGFVLFAGGHPYPGAFANGAVRRTGPTEPMGAAAALDHAERFFAGHERRFVVWIRDHADEDLAQECVRRGYPVREPIEGLTGVAADHPPDADHLTPPTGFTVRAVDTERGYLDYLDIIADVYGFLGAPQPLLESVFFSLQSLRAECQPAYVVYAGDRPVSCCSVFLSDTTHDGLVGGMQWAGTRSEAAGHGLGRVATAHAWQRAFDEGASMVVGQASRRGTPAWNSIGYCSVTRYRRFYSPAAILDPTTQKS